jgi:hypothetical protein
VDENHAAIRDGLRQLGWDVLDLSAAGCGVPDLCVRLVPGISMFLEVKRPDIKKAEQAMTPAQEEWWRYCHRFTRVVQTVDEAHRELTHAKERL